MCLSIHVCAATFESGILSVVRPIVNWMFCTSPSKPECHSIGGTTAFLRRDAIMRKRSICCRLVSVCLSDRPHYRPTCRPVLYPDGWDIGKPISRPTNIILVFRPHVPIPNSKGNPFSGSVKYNGDGNICDFRLKSPSISETVQDRPVVAMKR